MAIYGEIGQRVELCSFSIIQSLMRRRALRVHLIEVINYLATLQKLQCCRFANFVVLIGDFVSDLLQRLDTVLARVETEKRMSLIKAWEESEKSKVENK